jgi:hypothetical protein
MLRTPATIMFLGLMGLGLTLTPIAPAQAGPVVTFTETGTFSESFSDDTVVCQTELYTVTVEGHSTTHLTASTDADGHIIPPLRFQEIIHAKVTEVPLDGTGVTYTGSFKQFDLETIRSVRHGEVIAEVDTDLGNYIAHGSDGSQVRQKLHAHFTINANGEVSVEFSVESTSC